MQYCMLDDCIIFVSSFSNWTTGDTVYGFNSTRIYTSPCLFL